MAVPKAKKQKQNPIIRQIARELFPTFTAIMLHAVWWQLKESGVNKFDQMAFLANVVDHVNYLCGYETNGALSPNEIKAIFEKDTGLDYSNIYIIK